tara:strand:- start:4324 stop:5244 length:921 start_codon:yes stop_codon:yes gene_type:complete
VKLSKNMSKHFYNFHKYNSSYYDKLFCSYKTVFQRNFLDKKVYETRFKFNNKYTSIVLLDKNESEILAHVGFRVHKANPQICRFIGFRFSTFVNKSLRGKGVYQEMMKFAEDFLKTELKVDLIYSWPNKINLISCLKDPKYKNLPLINTWQKEVLCSGEYDENNFEIKLEKISRVKNQLTDDDLEITKNLFTNRENKKYYKLKDPQGNNLILGKSKLNQDIYFSLLHYSFDSLPWILNLIERLGSKSCKNFVQLWCDFNEYENLRMILKSGFEPNGPTFNRGVYILDRKNVSNIYAFPSMYHHDAF